MSMALHPFQSTSPGKQRGAVAIIVALSALALFAFAGLSIDLGRLYVNKTELQTAADACALAASAELTCDSTVAGACPASFLQIAQSAGRFAANRNARDFQTNPVAIVAADVRFHTSLSPNASYLSITAGASTNSRYVMCIARAAGITPWFMGAVGAGVQAVTATAVATRAPGTSICPTAPIGVCRVAGSAAPNFGYAVDKWVAGSFNNSGGGEGVSASIACPASNPGCVAGGSFRWIDYTPSAGGTNEVRDHLNGSLSVCNISVGSSVNEEGTKQGAKDAYNGRFGVYSPGGGPTAPTPQTNPPDRTGYSYPSKNPGPVIGIGDPGAYADYRARQGTFANFVRNEYDNAAAGGNFNPAPNQPTLAERQTFGQDRRLFAAPFIQCGAGAPTSIVGMGCFLMLNPMSNGANGTIFLQYRGLTTAADSPCRTGGFAGGPASTGAQVPTLVQ